MSNINEREKMNTNTNILSLVQEAVSCIAFSNDMRKSAKATGKQRQIDSANEAASEALEYIRKAQQRLDEMVAEINSKL
jgi:chemotaxis response regulator CheB